MNGVRTRNVSGDGHIKMATMQPYWLFKKIYCMHQPFIKHYFTTNYKLMISNHLQVTGGSYQNIKLIFCS
jgi:hypothetical protein